MESLLWIPDITEMVDFPTFDKWEQIIKMNNDDDINDIILKFKEDNKFKEMFEYLLSNDNVFMDDSLLDKLKVLKTHNMKYFEHIVFLIDNSDEDDGYTLSLRRILDFLNINI